MVLTGRGIYFDDFVVGGVLRGFIKRVVTVRPVRSASGPGAWERILFRSHVNSFEFEGKTVGRSKEKLSSSYRMGDRSHGSFM